MYDWIPSDGDLYLVEINTHLRMRNIDTNWVDVDTLNTFLQVAGHNRSSNDGNHPIENIEYWPWFAEENQKLVNLHKQYLIDNSMFEVLSDAQKLTKIFCNEQELMEA